MTFPWYTAGSPEDQIKACGKDAIGIPHHIGIGRYRGINWDAFDSSISPVVEVYSKHGCGMCEEADYPYYHNMGPRDGRNLIYEGLKRGKQFSFVASTDHHAGFPGSYGDGMAAVWQKKKAEKIFGRPSKLVAHMLLPATGSAAVLI